MTRLDSTRPLAPLHMAQVIRRRLQLQGMGAPALVEQHRGWLDCFHHVVRFEGWPALYRGLGVAIVRSIPNTGIQFAVYEACKSLIARIELSQP